MAVAALQAEYTAALFKLESGRQSMADLDRYIAEAEAEIASKPDIREVEAEGAERRLVPPSLPWFRTPQSGCGLRIAPPRALLNCKH